VRVQDVNAVTAEVSREPEEAGWIFNPATTVATETLHALGLHMVAQPRRDRIERSEEHLVATSIVPGCKLREEPAGVAVLREVQDSLPCFL